MTRLQRLELLKDMIQEAIDRGASSVEQIHQAIADLPFEALEKAGLLNEPAQQLRDKQQRSVGMVYGAIRRINHEVGQLISDQFENLEETRQAAGVIDEHDATSSEPAASIPPTRKAAAKKKSATHKLQR